MTTARKYKSKAFDAIHSSASALHKIAAISKVTMHDFDESCLASIATINYIKIKKIREKNQVSQPVFARYLNGSKSTAS